MENHNIKIGYKLFIPVLLIIFLTTIGLGWLALGVLIVSLMYILFTSSLRWVKWIKRNGWPSGILSFVGIFAMGILLRLFIFEIFSIPSSSMEDTLQPGDHVVLSKLNYGPQLPRSPFEIPWLNLFFLLNQEARAKTGVDWWEYRRWEGYSSIKRNDIVIFKLPAENNQPYIKRCVGLPGEQFQMIDGQAFCDGQKIETPASLQNRYQLWLNNQIKSRHLLNSLQISLTGIVYKKEVWELLLNGTEKDLLERSDAIDSITPILLQPGEGDRAFPNVEGYSWSIDYFGPLLIPAKGMTIALDTGNFQFYKNILRNFENLPVYKKEGRILADSKEVREYTFQQNYYFMLGDNRPYSKDSRFIGFIPEENIIGKAVCILFSSGKEGWKWDRTFKMLE